MNKDEALRLALEALENSDDLVRENAYSAEQLYGNYPARQGKVRGLKALVEDHEKAITAIKAALEAKDEPVAHSVVAGALFDFMGWLTSREKRLILSSVDEASPAVEAITEFAKKRNLSLKYAEVGYWTEFLSTPPQQEAKDEPVFHKPHLDIEGPLHVVCRCPACKAQPQRTWVGLTDEEIGAIAIKSQDGFSPHDDTLRFARAIEAKLKEKNA
jgi:hypothetical protein